MSLPRRESKQPVSSLSPHSWYAKCRHCERCAVGIQRSSRLSKQYTQTLCVPTSPPYIRSCSDQTLSSPCPLMGNRRDPLPPPGAGVPTVWGGGELGGMWRRNLRHFTGALHKPERTDGTLFNFFSSCFFLLFFCSGGGEGIGELIVKVYYVEFKSQRKTQQNPSGTWRGDRNKWFLLAELGLPMHYFEEKKNLTVFFAFIMMWEKKYKHLKDDHISIIFQICTP